MGEAKRAASPVGSARRCDGSECEKQRVGEDVAGLRFFHPFVISLANGHS